MSCLSCPRNPSVLRLDWFKSSRHSVDHSRIVSNREKAPSNSRLTNAKDDRSSVSKALVTETILGILP